MIPSNPFALLLTKLENRIRSSEKPDNFSVKVAGQIRLLKALYRAMMEYDMRQHFPTSADDWELHNFKSTMSVLNYLQFITILNQLGRILEEEGIPMPKFNRIRFFRNKVYEHWEDYTQYGVTGSHYQAFGEASVPSTATTHLVEERKSLKSEIDVILKGFGLYLEIDNPEVGNIADLNTEQIYAILEKIDPSLNQMKSGKYVIPDELIELLFKFGFPAPIQKVSEYSSELTAHLESKLGV